MSSLVKLGRGWRSSLADKIESRRRMPYNDDTNNCGLFAADCIYAMTGVDIASPFREMTRQETEKAISDMGYADYVEYVGSFMEEIAPDSPRPGARALMGDIAVLEDKALGVVLGAYIAVLSPRGVGNRPVSEAVRIFRIPE